MSLCKPLLKFPEDEPIVKKLEKYSGNISSETYQSPDFQSLFVKFNNQVKEKKREIYVLILEVLASLKSHSNKPPLANTKRVKKLENYLEVSKPSKYYKVYIIFLVQT